eukprot:1306181-Pyramimonas_sp.AAC.1
MPPAHPQRPPLRTEGAYATHVATSTVYYLAGGNAMAHQWHRVEMECNRMPAMQKAKAPCGDLKGKT